MGDLSKHFSRYEFACACGCGRDTVDSELLDVLESVRQTFNQVVTVTSAHRCEAHNHDVGGSTGSQHLLGRAADIVVHNTPPASVARMLDEAFPTTFGIGTYETFVHIDTRDAKARWTG